MSTYWLQKKRKAELIGLARDVNLPDAEGLLKDDLVEQLAEHLEANESVYGKDPNFVEFYRRGSPIKRERASPEASGLTLSKARRRTIVKKAESDEFAFSPRRTGGTPTRTPSQSGNMEPLSASVGKAALSPLLAVDALSAPVDNPASSSHLAVEPFPAPVDIPASPSQLAEVADQSFRAARDRASQLWTRSRVEEYIALARENASSVVFIQFAILFIEGAGLEWNTLKSIWVFDTPAVAGLPAKQVSLPDFQLLLTTDYWGPATLWSLTSWILPLFVSYFFNLTLRSNTRHKSANRQYTVDPFTFNIARALLAWSAYSVPTVPASVAGEPNTVLSYTPGWGPFAESTVATVRSHVPAGYTGLQIGSAIGLLYSLYDAALKK